MKKITLLLVMVALTENLLIGQHLLRVNNNGFDPDFTSLGAAVAAAVSGDTIYMEGSAVAYTGCSINKKLTIIGPGYFLGENPKTQATSLEAQFSSSITFAVGSSGSTIMGCYLKEVNLIINADDISVMRNHLYGIEIKNAVKNINILQNYMNGTLSASDTYGGITNSVISNNYLYYGMDFGSLSGGLIITNNISLYGTISTYNSTIQNNIVAYSSYNIPENTGNTISYNLMAATGTNANNNQYNIDMTSVFLDYYGDSGVYSTDGQWGLAEGSPAKGAGSGGTDCGIFGGTVPYVLSGIPNLPHIYEADVPAAISSGSTLNISIKVKSGD